MRTLCLSQRELAEKLEMTRPSICKYLSGERRPSCAAVRKFVKFANDNGISLTYEDFLENP
jgi:transcriptional regulator with XRE-family HTH domain